MIIRQNYFLSMGLLFLACGLAFIFAAFMNVDSGRGATLGTMASGLIVASSIFLMMYRSSHEDNLNKSKFYMKKCVWAIKVAYETISNSNKREHWILAARQLSRVNKLLPFISEESHIEAFHIVNDEYKMKFYTLFEKHKNGTGSFFAGLNNPNIPLEEALEQQTRNPELISLDLSSIKVVYDFCKYPKDYSDPLSRERFLQDEFEWIEIKNKALANYIHFCSENMFYSAPKSARLRNLNN